MSCLFSLCVCLYQVRPQALIINLEMCKCIISRTYALINNTDVDRVRPLLDALRDRLKHNSVPTAGIKTAPQPPTTATTTTATGITDTGSVGTAGADASTAPARAPSPFAVGTAQMPVMDSVGQTATGHALPSNSTAQGQGNSGSVQGGPVGGVGSGGSAAAVGGDSCVAGEGQLKAMPFELTVLEVCLEQVRACLCVCVCVYLCGSVHMRLLPSSTTYVRAPGVRCIYVCVCVFHTGASPVRPSGCRARHISSRCH